MMRNNVFSGILQAVIFYWYFFTLNKLYKDFNMFDKPEEIMMAILLALWVSLSYFLASYTGASIRYVLLICGFNAAWAVLAFILWKANFIGKLWPLLIGVLVACWWPWLNWFATRHIQGDVIAITPPWYASLTFKLIYAVIPVILGYFWKWRQTQKPRFDQK